MHGLQKLKLLVINYYTIGSILVNTHKIDEKLSNTLISQHERNYRDNTAVAVK